MTIRAQVRAYLQAIAAEHTPTATGCSAGDELDAEAPFERHLLDVIAAGVEEPPTRPHRVKSKGSVAAPVVTVATPADETDPRPKGTRVTGATYVGPLDCPDCGQGLVSRGTDMACPRLELGLKVKGSGGVVACGVRSTDG